MVYILSHNKHKGRSKFLFEIIELDKLYKITKFFYKSGSVNFDQTKENESRTVDPLSPMHDYSQIHIKFINQDYWISRISRSILNQFSWNFTHIIFHSCRDYPENFALTS